MHHVELFPTWVINSQCTPVNLITVNDFEAKEFISPAEQTLYYSVVKTKRLQEDKKVGGKHIFQ